MHPLFTSISDPQSQAAYSELSMDPVGTWKCNLLIPYMRDMQSRYRYNTIHIDSPWLGSSVGRAPGIYSGSLGSIPSLAKISSGYYKWLWTLGSIPISPSTCGCNRPN